MRYAYQIFIFFIGLATSLSAFAASPSEVYQRNSKIFLEELKLRKESIYQRKFNELETHFAKEDNKLDNDFQSTQLRLERQLLKFLSSSLNNAYRPHALFQLGSLYFQMGEDNPKFFKESEKYLSEILRNHRSFSFREQALYILAYSRLQQDRESQAIAAFQTLLQEFPKSQFIQESYLRIGEYLFHKTNYKKALGYYQAITKDQASPFYHKALYKTAWVHYLSADYAPALDGFLRIVNQGEKTQFFTEAKEYVAFSLLKQRASIAQVDNLKRYGWDQQKFDIGMRYAELLADNGEFNKSSQLYSFLSKNHPKYEGADRAQYLAAQSLQLAGDEQGALRMNQDYLSRYPDPTQLRGKVLFAVGSYYYEGWRLNRLTKNDLKRARDLFDEATTTAPGTKEAYESNFFGAEASYVLGDFNRAATNYRQVLMNANLNHHFEDALKAIIVTHEKRLAAAKDPFTKKLVAKDLLAAFDDFSSRSNNAKELPNTLFKSGQILALLGRQDDAIDRFNQLVHMYPNSDLVEKSSAEIISTLMTAERWPDVIGWVHGIQTNPNLAKKTKLQKKARDAEFDARVATAKKFEEKKQYLKAANLLVSTHDKFSAKPEAASLLFYAARLYDREHQLGLAADTYVKHIKLHPKSKHSVDARVELSSIFERLFLHEQAYGLLKDAPGNSANEAVTVINLSAISRQMGRYDSAAQLLLKLKPRTENERQGALKEAADLYAEKNDFKQAAQVAERLYRISKKPGDAVEAAGHLVRAGQLSRAQTLLNPIVRRTKNISADVAAQTLYLKGEIARSVFVRRNKANADVSNQLDALEQAERYYLQSINIGDAHWTSAALYRLGTMYSTLGESLKSAGQVDIAEKLLQKSEEIHARNLNATSSGGHYSIWAKRTATALMRLRGIKPDLLNSYEFIERLELINPKAVFFDASGIGEENVDYGGVEQSASVLAKRAQQLLEEDPSHPEIIPLLETLSAIRNVSPLVQYNLALAYYHQGNFKASIEQVKSLRQRYTTPDVDILHGNNLIRLRQYKEARLVYENLTKTSPESIASKMNLIFTYLLLKEPESSMKVVRAMLKEGIEHPQIYLLCYFIFRSQSRFALAKEALSRGVEKFPSNSRLLAQLAASNNRSNDYDGLKPVFDKRGKISPDNQLLNNLAVALMLNGDYESARQELLGALALKRTNSSLYNLALANYLKGDFEAAVTSYQQYRRNGGKEKPLEEVLKP